MSLNRPDNATNFASRQLSQRPVVRNRKKARRVEVRRACESKEETEAVYSGTERMQSLTTIPENLFWARDKRNKAPGRRVCKCEPYRISGIGGRTLPASCPGVGTPSLCLRR